MRNKETNRESPIETYDQYLQRYFPKDRETPAKGEESARDLGAQMARDSLHRIKEALDRARAA